MPDGMFDDLIPAKRPAGGMFDDLVPARAEAAPSFANVVSAADTVPVSQPAVESEPPSLLSIFGDAIRRGAASSLAGVVHSGADLVDQTVQGAIRPIGELLGHQADPLGAAALARESLGAEQEIGADRAAMAQAIGGRPELVDLLEQPLESVAQYGRHLANIGGESLPIMAAAIATRNPELGAGLLGGVTGAQEYTGLRGQGVDRGEAAEAATLSGLIESAGEAFGLPLVMGRGGGLGGFARAALGEGAQEVPVAIGQQLVQDQATGTETPIAQQLGDALDAFLVGAGLGAGGHGVSVATDRLAGAEPPADDRPPSNAIAPELLTLLQPTPEPAAPTATPAAEDMTDLDTMLLANLPKIVESLDDTPSAPAASTPNPPLGRSDAPQAQTSLAPEATPTTATAVQPSAGQPAPAPAGGDLAPVVMPPAPAIEVQADDDTPDPPLDIRYGKPRLPPGRATSARRAEEPSAEQTPSDDGNWISADRAFVSQGDNEFGPMGADQDAVRFAREAPEGTTTLEVKRRPSGKQWSTLYLSLGNGEISSHSLGSGTDAKLDDAVSTIRQKDANSARMADDHRTMLESQAERQRAIASRNGYAVGSQLGTIIPNTGKALRAARIVAADGNGNFDVQGVAGNREAIIRGITAGGIEDAVQRQAGKRKPQEPGDRPLLSEDADPLADAARSFFGTTQDPREAGYILPDGAMLDFTGRHYSDDHPSLRGRRNVDHRELTGENMRGESLDDLFQLREGSGSDYMQEFMGRTAAMRVDFSAGVASVMGQPTTEQVQALARGLRGDYAALSVVDPTTGRIIDEAEIDNPTPMKVRRFFDQARGKTAAPDAPLFSEEQADDTANTLTNQHADEQAESRGLKQAVRDLLGDVPVEWIAGTDTLPAALRSRLRTSTDKRGRKMRTKGLFDPKTGKVYLVAANLRDGHDAAWTAAHEIAGHKGLRALFKDKEGLRKALSIAQQNPTVAKLADAIYKYRNYAGRVGEKTESDLQFTAIEESLAELAAAVRTGDYDTIQSRYGVNVAPGIRASLNRAIDNFIRRIKALFDRQGAGFSDAEVRELLEAAWQAARVDEAGVDGDAMEQTVFHGTPHTVDKFSLQKIGTGEGAQAFGWGMYFAGKKEIAEHYRHELTAREASRAGDHAGVLVNIALKAASGDRAKALEIARSRDDGSARDAEVIRRLESGDTGGGKLYRVEVPEDSDLLDFDKPMSQQPAKVRAAALNVWNTLPEWFHDEVLDRANAEFDDLTGNEFYQALGIFNDEGSLPGRFEHPDIFDRAVDSREAASHALYVAGIPGLRYLDGGSRKAGEGTHNYVIWDEAAIGDPEVMESVEDANVNAELRRNEAATTLPVQRGSAGWNYDEGKWEGRRGQLETARARLQDKMIAWRDVQGQIESQLGQAIPDAQNVYRLETLMHGRVSEGIDRIEREQVKPLMEAMRAAGVKPDELEEYLYARHAAERNAQIASINPSMPDGGSGMTNAEAAAILGKADKAKLDPLARKVDAITRSTRKRLLASGLITQEAFDAMDGQYQSYVPLRGKATKETDFGNSGPAGRGLDSRAKPVQQAMGRGAGNRAQHILGEVIGDAERSIILAEKARVGRAVMRIVLANPNPNLWQVEPVQTERAVDANGEVYERVVNDWSDPSIVAVRHRGQLYKVQINSAPLAQALNHVGIDHLGALTRVAGAVNRYFSAILTKYNPAFTPVNATRDALFGLTGLAAEHGELAAMDAALHYPQAARAAWRQARHKGDGSQWDQWADEFAAAGGKTGYVNMPSAEEIARKIGTGKLTGYSPDGLRKVARVVGDVVGAANDAVENALRLSAYVTLRKRGMSQEKAAEYAKNLTVNFNRKGFDGSKLNAWFLFYNASIQGAHRTSKLLRKPKTWGYLGALASAQVIATLAAMGMRDDNDEPLWNKVPDHVKRRNLVIVTADGGLVTIPMPYGFNLFPYMAGRIAEKVSNAQRGDNRASDGAAQLTADLLSTATQSFSPIPLDEGTFGLIPNLLRIPLSVQANRNDFGNRIRNESPYSKSDVPRASMGRPDTLEVFKLTATGLNRLGGGDDLTPPPLSAFDVAPEDLEYLFKELTGGPGALVADIATVGQKITGGDYAREASPRDIPITKRFVSNIDEQAAQQALFYNRREVVDRALKRVRSVYQSEGPEAAEALLNATPELTGAAFKRRKRDTENGKAGSIIEVNGSPQIIASDASRNRGERGRVRNPGELSVFAAYKKAEDAIKARNENVEAAYSGTPASILPTERSRQRDAFIETENRIRQAAQVEFNGAWVRDVVGAAG